MQRTKISRSEKENVIGVHDFSAILFRLTCRKAEFSTSLFGTLGIKDVWGLLY